MLQISWRVNDYLMATQCQKASPHSFVSVFSMKYSGPGSPKWPLEEVFPHHQLALFSRKHTVLRPAALALPLNTLDGFPPPHQLKAKCHISRLTCSSTPSWSLPPKHALCSQLAATPRLAEKLLLGPLEETFRSVPGPYPSLSPPQDLTLQGLRLPWE